MSDLKSRRLEVHGVLLELRRYEGGIEIQIVEVTPHDSDVEGREGSKELPTLLGTRVHNLTIFE